VRRTMDSGLVVEDSERRQREGDDSEPVMSTSL